MPEVRIYRKTIYNANILTVEAGTNCPQGGDGGHGGRSVLRFIDDGGTAMAASIDGRPLEDAQRIDVLFGGDSERDTLIDALKFAIGALDGDNHFPDSHETEDVDFYREF